MGAGRLDLTGGSPSPVARMGGQGGQQDRQEDENVVHGMESLRQRG